MTRANTASMLPKLSGGGSDVSRQLGNPNLRPYYSNNIDLGAELYTGGEGYIGVGHLPEDDDGLHRTTSRTRNCSRTWRSSAFRSPRRPA